MYMHHYGFDQGWFINMPFWAVPFLGFVMIAALWSIAWKGIGLWHAARRGDHWWFVAILLINTLGILEIIYLFFISKLTFDELLSKKEHHHSHGEHSHHSHS
jgi:hypothetical protein